MHLRRLALAILAVAALALAPLAVTAPAYASPPCDYDNKVYCDGGDEPGWQWDTIDDYACVQIPGAYLDENDKPVYTGVVGKVYYQGVLVWDSTPAPEPKPSTKPKPKPKPTSSGSTASAPKPSSKPADKPKPSATPTPTPTPTPSATEEPVDAADRSLTISGDHLAGATITISGSGFAAGVDDVTIELHSSPVVELAKVTTDAVGAFTTEVTIPEDVAPGDHEIVVLVNGYEVATTPFTIPGADDGQQLASLLLLGGLAAAGAAALLVYSLRRRRRPATASAD